MKNKKLLINVHSFQANFIRVIKFKTPTKKERVCVPFFYLPIYIWAQKQRFALATALSVGPYRKKSEIIANRRCFRISFAFLKSQC